MRRAVWLVVLAACGRIGFDGLRVPDAPDADDDEAGLVLHLTFEADGPLLDRSPFAHATACSGPCPTSVAGPRGDAAQFGGASCVTIADAPELRPAQLTFATWGKFDAGQQGNFFGRPHGGGTTPDNTFEAFASPPDQIVVHVDTMATRIPVAVGAWHHVAGTFDGTMLVIYVDGTAQAMLPTAPMFVAGDDLLVGCDRDTGAFVDFLTGAVDDVRMYDRALSAAEVQRLATP